MKYRTKCPKCGAGERRFTRGFMYPHGGNQLERYVLCLDCGHSWLEIYDTVLVNIQDKPYTPQPEESAE